MVFSPCPWEHRNPRDQASDANTHKEIRVEQGCVNQPCARAGLPGSRTVLKDECGVPLPTTSYPPNSSLGLLNIRKITHCDLSLFEHKTVDDGFGHTRPGLVKKSHKEVVTTFLSLRFKSV